MLSLAKSRTFDTSNENILCQNKLENSIVARSSSDSLIPAVVHHDGTARIQILNQDDKSVISILLKKFASKYGLGILINTSFNVRGEPIVKHL